MACLIALILVLQVGFVAASAASRPTTHQDAIVMATGPASVALSQGRPSDRTWFSAKKLIGPATAACSPGELPQATSGSLHQPEFHAIFAALRDSTQYRAPPASRLV